MAELRDILISGDIVDITTTRINGRIVDDLLYKNEARSFVPDFKAFGYNPYFQGGDPVPQGWLVGQGSYVADIQGRPCYFLDDVDANAPYMNTAVTADDWADVRQWGMNLTQGLLIPASAADLHLWNIQMGFSLADNPYADLGWLTKGAYSLAFRRNGLNVEMQDRSAGPWTIVGLADEWIDMTADVNNDVMVGNLSFSSPSLGIIKINIGLWDNTGNAGPDGKFAINAATASAVGNKLYLSHINLLIGNSSSYKLVTEADVANEIAYKAPPMARNYLYEIPSTPVPNGSKFTVTAQNSGNLIIRRNASDFTTIINGEDEYRDLVLPGTTVYYDIEQFQPGFTAGQNWWVTRVVGNGTVQASDVTFDATDTGHGKVDVQEALEYNAKTLVMPDGETTFSLSSNAISLDTHVGSSSTINMRKPDASGFTFSSGPSYTNFVNVAPGGATTNIFQVNPANLLFFREAVVFDVATTFNGPVAGLANITYDNTTSGMAAIQTQAAIDEVHGLVGSHKHDRITSLANNNALVMQDGGTILHTADSGAFTERHVRSTGEGWQVSQGTSHESFFRSVNAANNPGADESFGIKRDGDLQFYKETVFDLPIVVPSITNTVGNSRLTPHEETMLIETDSTVSGFTSTNANNNGFTWSSDDNFIQLLAVKGATNNEAIIDITKFDGGKKVDFKFPVEFSGGVTLTELTDGFSTVGISSAATFRFKSGTNSFTANFLDSANDGFRWTRNSAGLISLVLSSGGTSTFTPMTIGSGAGGITWNTENHFQNVVNFSGAGTTGIKISDINTDFLADSVANIVVASDSWQPVVQIATGTVPAGTFRCDMNASWITDTVVRNTLFRLSVNGGAWQVLEREAKDISNTNILNLAFPVVTTGSAIISLELQVRKEGAADNTTVVNANVMLERKL